MVCRAAGRWGPGPFYCPTGETGHLGNRLGDRERERQVVMVTCWESEKQIVMVTNLGVIKRGRE